MSFDEAETVFSDENALLFDDPEHSADDDRFVRIRLISARKATRTERHEYAARTPVATVSRGRLKVVATNGVVDGCGEALRASPLC